MGNDMDWKIGPIRTIWIGRLDQFERYGLEDWTNSNDMDQVWTNTKFENSICECNANIRMSYKLKETVYPGVEPKQPQGN